MSGSKAIWETASEKVLLKMGHETIFCDLLQTAPPAGC